MTLITRQADLVALSLLALVLFLGQEFPPAYQPPTTRARHRHTYGITRNARNLGFATPPPRTFRFLVNLMEGKMANTSAALAVLFTLASGTSSLATEYVIDLTHSHLLFMVDHLGFSKMVGLFTDFGGTFSFEPNNISSSKLAVTIRTDSLQTQFRASGSRPQGADWFNATEFPEMTYVGTSFRKKDDHSGTITGNLMLRGVTNPVSLEVV